MTVERIVSGGQAGVDRAALDAATDAGVPCGGWCPRNRWSEDGPIPQRYPLLETPSADPALRTEWNVRDADATLILAPGRPTGGTALAKRLAEQLGRPCLVVDYEAANAAADIARWIAATGARVLNVAGPRESEAPGAYGRARALLGAVLAAPTAGGSGGTMRPP